MKTDNEGSIKSEFVILTEGAHEDVHDGVCALELIHLLVTGEHADKTPDCLSPCLSVLPLLNDGPWLDDKSRTSTLLPWIPKLMGLRRHEEKDIKRHYRLLDALIRKILPENIEDTESAVRLADLPVIQNQSSARTAKTTLKEILQTCQYQSYHLVSETYDVVKQYQYPVSNHQYAENYAGYIGEIVQMCAQPWKQDPKHRNTVKFDLRITRYSNWLLEALCEDVE